ncbi:MAG: hypothetical protein Q4G18_08655 [Myroides sp.]|nr:hypothetical protein [Myroides sp.]
MKKYTVINVLAEANRNLEKNIKRHATIHIENIKEVELVIEKINTMPVNLLMVDTSMETSNIEKLTKIAGLLNPDIQIQTFNPEDDTYEENVLRFWRDDFIGRMSAHSYEDNPNLYNPFLNMNKNIFN